MQNQKYKLTSETIELKLKLHEELPNNGMPPPWHIYLQRVGKDSESILSYTMQTLDGKIVIDQLLVHVEMLKTEELNVRHLERYKNTILKELERIGHVVRVHRIEAMRFFGDVKCGDKGGFVQRMTNLSHNDNCWVANDAIICGDATVCDDAVVCGSAIVTSGSVYEKARIGANVRVHGGSVCGRAKIIGSTEIRDGDRLCGDTVYDGPYLPEPVIIYKGKMPRAKLELVKSSFCQFPFNNGKPRLPRRTPGGNMHHEMDVTVE